MKNLLVQTQVVTNAVKNQLLGWWYEQFFFYVKHRDLEARDILTSMMLDPSTDVSSLRHATGNAWTYVFDDGVDWVQLCLEKVVEEYFRDEGEAWNAFVISAGRPASKINGVSFMQSVVDRTTILDPADVGLTVGVDDEVMASELDATMRQYRLLKDYALIDMSYEDWLATHGIRTASIELHRPELIRFTREWKYPGGIVPNQVSNQSEASGLLQGRVRWAIAERADKDRFFREPGFVFGVSLCRPKVYLRGQTGAGVGMLDDAYAWLPAVLRNDKATSLKEFAASQGPLQGTTNPYVVDVRDLFLYGDQFVNYAVSDTNNNLVDLPNALLTNKRYPDSDDANELFVTPATENEIFSDGIVSLNIASVEDVDATPEGRNPTSG